MNPMNPESTPSIQERLIDELLREPLFDGDSEFVKELQQQLDAADRQRRNRGFQLIVSSAAALLIGMITVATWLSEVQRNEREAPLHRNSFGRNSIDALLGSPIRKNQRELTSSDQEKSMPELYGAGGMPDVDYDGLHDGLEIASDFSPFGARTSSVSGALAFIELNPGIELTPGNRYAQHADQSWKQAMLAPVSTFSIDVDHASYTHIRGMLRAGEFVPRDAVRIEECINAFSYDYRGPAGDAPFAVGADVAECPWAPGNHLVRIAIKGKEIDTSKRPESNLVFLLDVSGSMMDPNKLPLVQHSMRKLAGQLDERDRVSIVVYAGNEGVALPPTRMDAAGREAVMSALERLVAGGSTNGGAGIVRAYQLAQEQLVPGGTNRVILATDGDFNVGLTENQTLVDLVKEKAKDGVYLTVLGYGMGNLNDEMMDAITRDGNGNYYYIDSASEGDRVFGTNLAGTLVTIAKDVKIQVEFNPAMVADYRLVGYANRMLANEDFANDKVDAGDIGSGHTVTAFYEVKPVRPESRAAGLRYQRTNEATDIAGEWLGVKLRYKAPDGDTSRLTEFSLEQRPTRFAEADDDFRFASAVAMFGMKLRGQDEDKNLAWERIRSIADGASSTGDVAQRREFVEMLTRLAQDEARKAGVSTESRFPQRDRLPEPAEVKPDHRPIRRPNTEIRPEYR